MKKLIFLLSLSTFIIGSYAQTTVFFDDFEKYSVGDNLATKGYILLYRGAKVGSDGTNKYALCDVNVDNLYFQKKLTLVAGKTYKWTVKTKRDATTGKHVLEVMDATWTYKYTTKTELTNGNEWVTTTFEFRVLPGYEDVLLSMYQWNRIGLYIDDFKVEDTQKTEAIRTKVGSAFSDNMVLQRNTTVKIWGEEKPNSEVKITTGWDNKIYTTIANSDGKWFAFLNTPDASENAYTLKVEGEATINFSNILIGEVWLASGQSNMNMPLDGWTSQPVEGSDLAKQNATDSKIRLLKIAENYSLTPNDYVSGVWKEASPTTVGSFSAAAYFYAKMLRDSLKIPIGIINCSYSGSKIEAWLPSQVINTLSFVSIPTEFNSEYPQVTPTVLYNAMLRPIVGYTLKGAIWYQGEGNRNKPEEYLVMLPAMINSWREMWGIGNFPFYFVQIAPYGNNVDAPFWNMMKDTYYSVPKTGMVVTLDIGECTVLHPSKKKTVGERLALWALANDYGYNLTFSGPLCKSANRVDNTLKLTFDFTAGGLVSAPGGLTGFEIAGSNQVYYPATALIKEDKTITLSSTSVASPKYARYAYGTCANIKATLYNSAGLPASAFIIEENTQTGLKDTYKNKISVFPNPTNDILSIKGFNVNSPVEIISLTGNSIYKTQGQNPLNISFLQQGMYFLKHNEAIIKFNKQ